MYSDMRLLKDLRENHKNDYRIYLRMDDETFSYVLKSSRRDKYRRVFAARERKITSKDTPLSARSAGLVHTLAGWHGGRCHGTPKIKPILIAIVPCNARRA
ncbi:hypothetical protein J6590_089305 [Homalodisca vitripennis]|nr:hypothetical protein J6590_089305 [Homalodisca vitripennis]